MEKLKEISIKAIENLPDNCTVEDIMYEINVVAQIIEGIEDANNGKVISTEEILNQIKEWGK